MQLGMEKKRGAHHEHSDEHKDHSRLAAQISWNFSIACIRSGHFGFKLIIGSEFNRNRVQWSG
jgi:hypothetical protein